MFPFSKKRNLQGMVVIITGASSGIGRSLAKILSYRGCRLALVARRRELLESLNAELGGEHLVLPGDITKREDCERIVYHAFSHFQRLDVLVCNAGYGWAGALEKMQPERIEDIFNTNFFGTLWCVRAVIPLMKTQPEKDGRTGHIVIVSSACARRGVPYMGVYSATKAAQLNLAEALRPELHADGVYVSSVHPLTVDDTEFFEGINNRSSKPGAFVPGKKQSVEEVVRAIVCCLERPRPEVWPKPFSRFSLICSVIFRRLTDWVLIHFHCRRFRRDNEMRHQSSGNPMPGVAAQE